MSWKVVVLIAYLSCLLPLAVLGLHRLLLVLTVARHRGPQVAPEPPSRWPVVTVQLPLFDERDVVARLLHAVASLDYPRDRLEVQVLDDSRDDTTARAEVLVRELRQAGLDVVLLHRTDRVGFKAGALAAGLRVARGDLIAIFDADFVPPPDFLRRTVPWLLQDDVGMVQARWGHLNAHESWLTAAQATLLDGHFVIEHSARYRTGRWFNFNGTAGVWRRQAIEAAGGWQHDTLTEDLDLSYRAQLAGYRFVYLDDLVVPAELPSTMAAFQAQQARWARGGLQTARKLLPRVWRAPVALAVKVEATFHLLANSGYPVAVGVALLLPPAVVARVGAPVVLLGLDLVLFLAATLSIFLFYGGAVRWSGGGPIRPRLLALPVVLGLGLGIALSQTRAVLHGLVGPVGAFERTPKKGTARIGSYHARLSGVLVLELAMGTWLLGGLLWAVANGLVLTVPFVALFAGGYAAVAMRTVSERRAPSTGGP